MMSLMEWKRSDDGSVINPSSAGVAKPAAAKRGRPKVKARRRKGK
jgi:hypothetical protein